MATVQQSELAEFYEYLGKHVRDPLPHPMPEDVLDEWRIERGDIVVDEVQRATHDEDVAAIREALRDMEAGEVGMEVEEFFREFDAHIRERMDK